MAKEGMWRGLMNLDVVNAYSPAFLAAVRCAIFDIFAQKCALQKVS
jgi:hypothetical protein